MRRPPSASVGWMLWTCSRDAWSTARMQTVEPEADRRVRLAAFEWLREQIDRRGDDVLPWALLLQGFEFGGRRVPLLSQQGIFKPAAISSVPLSIRTSISGPYDDSLFADDLMLYRYRGTDPSHRDNVGLRRAMAWRVPLIYFYGITRGAYLSIHPVFVVHDDPGALSFSIAVDDPSMGRGTLDQRLAHLTVADAETDSRRIYVTATVRQRLHQRSFRERVLDAYRSRCLLCRLARRELLEAAHIRPDSQGGDPHVRNGMALCKIHHAAFDRHILGIRPDLVVQVRGDVLEEIDGPMLQHGIKELHDLRIPPAQLPKRRPDWPDPALLAQRWERFESRAAATGP